MSARRGDIVLVRSRKHEPYQAVGRPALVVQSDDIDSEAYDTLAVCLITDSSTRSAVPEGPTNKKRALARTVSSASAFSMISGPIPRTSPSVTAMTGSRTLSAEREITAPKNS